MTAHVCALYAIIQNNVFFGVENVNLGTGNGYTVLELIHTFEKVNNVEIPYEIVERRPGDIGVAFADPSYGKKLLSWSTKLNLEDMCRDAWRWRGEI